MEACCPFSLLFYILLPSSNCFTLIQFVCGPPRPPAPHIPFPTGDGRQRQRERQSSFDNNKWCSTPPLLFPRPAMRPVQKVVKKPDSGLPCLFSKLVKSTAMMETDKLMSTTHGKVKDVCDVSFPVCHLFFHCYSQSFSY